MIQCVLGIRKHLTIYQSYNKVCYDNSACFLMSLRTAYSFVLTDITLITSFIHTIYIQLASLFMINLSSLLNLKPWSKSFFFLPFLKKFHWMIVDLQCCDFCCTTVTQRCMYTHPLFFRLFSHTDHCGALGRVPYRTGQAQILYLHLLHWFLHLLYHVW